MARRFDDALALALGVKLPAERLAMKLFTVSPFAPALPEIHSTACGRANQHDAAEYGQRDR